MIKVTKKKSLCPARLRPLAEAERKKNQLLIRAKQFDKIKFGVYKDKALAAILEDLFNKKCAYCEARAAATSPWDIEHFRPKSKTFKKDEPKKGFIGYYWLAAEWDNLLLSCPNCNRPKKHQVPGRKDKILIGKHEQFPLDKEQLRCKTPDPKKLAAEEKVRLLINPCKEDPEVYFMFDEVTAPGNIGPRSTLTGFKLRRAEKSIEVYALHRIDLVDERARLLNELKFKMLVIDREINLYNNSKGKTQKGAVKNIQEYVDILVNYAMPNQEFSAMAKQVIGNYLKTINSSLKRIIGKSYV
jgi:uncharacterized protein (TIGR02646 family)